MSDLVHHRSAIQPAEFLGTPQRLSREDGAALQRLVDQTRDDGNGRYVTTIAMTNGQRTKLQARAMIIEDACRSGKSRRVKVQLGRLFDQYKSRHDDETDAELSVESYADALADLPPWAAASAIQAALRGGLPGQNPDFIPKSAALHRFGLEQLGALYREKAQIDRVLRARVEAPGSHPSEEAKARVAAAVAEVKRNLSAFPSTDFRQAVARDARDGMSGDEDLRAPISYAAAAPSVSTGLLRRFSRFEQGSQGTIKMPKLRKELEGRGSTLENMISWAKSAEEEAIRLREEATELLARADAEDAYAAACNDCIDRLRASYAASPNQFVLSEEAQA